MIVIVSVGVITGCMPRYGYDNLFSPNWDNRHAKFVGEYVDGRIGQIFDVICLDRCQTSFIDKDTARYTFTNVPGNGCTYWYDVDRTTRRIKDVQFTGSQEACSLTLN